MIFLVSHALRLVHKEDNVKREKMGAWSRALAKKCLNGRALGYMIVARLEGRPLKQTNLPPKVREHVTVGEIIDAIETLGQAHAALDVLAMEYERLVPHKRK